MRAVGRECAFGVKRRAQPSHELGNCDSDWAQFSRLFGYIERPEVACASIGDVAAEPRYWTHRAPHGQPDRQNIERNKSHERPEHGFCCGQSDLVTPLCRLRNGDREASRLVGTGEQTISANACEARVWRPIETLQRGVVRAKHYSATGIADLIA